MKQINFDMDGTIANLYGVDGWLNDIQNENTRPYTEAKPMMNMSALARVLNRLTNEGYSVNVISWTAKNGSEDYNARVAEAKRAWIAKHLKSVKFDNVFVIPYGTAKQNYGVGILFDDEEANRNAWNGTAYDEKDIIKVLKGL